MRSFGWICVLALLSLVGCRQDSYGDMLVREGHARSWALRMGFEPAYTKINCVGIWCDVSVLDTDGLCGGARHVYTLDCSHWIECRTAAKPEWAY